MKIELTSIKKGDHVGIFAAIFTPEAAKGPKPLYGLTANAAVFRPVRRLYELDKDPMLYVSVKEARQFARRLLALTRQDGDTESELEVENRELKLRVEELEQSNESCREQIGHAEGSNES